MSRRGRPPPYRCNAWLTWSAALSRSTSSHVSPTNSPWRSPVVQAAPGSGQLETDAIPRSTALMRDAAARLDELLTGDGAP